MQPADPRSSEKPLHCLSFFAVWFSALLYWELFLRICLGGISAANLTLLAFLPAEAFFLSALTGLSARRRIVNIIGNIVPACLICLYYFAQLVYHRLSGSLIPVGMIGMGGQAMGDFGWTIRGALLRSLLDLPFILVPLLVIVWLSFNAFPWERKNGRDVSTGAGTDIRIADEDSEIVDLDSDEEFDDKDSPERAKEQEDLETPEKDGAAEDTGEDRRPLLAGYPLWLHACFLAAAVVLWLLGGAFLSLLGHGRDSAWYAYHSELTDTDTSAERIGALATTAVETYVYVFGSERNLTESVGGGIDFEALQLPDKGGDPKKAGTVTSSEGAGSQLPAGEEDAAEEAVVKTPWENEAVDFQALSAMTEDENTKVLCNYFASRKATMTNEYTGLFEGYNLIYLCCEAFSGYGIDPEITPVLYRMASNGIVLKNFYNSFPNITTNGEFAFATSLWPDVSRSASNGVVAGSFPQSAGVFMPYGLGDLLTADGVPCYAYHNYRGDYYMRDYSWPNLGYPNENLKFMGRGMVFSNPWPASDLEMMEQSVDDYIGNDRFHAYYMTFSGHGPYDETNYMYRKNIAKVRELAGDRYTNSYCLGYFCGEYELELAMEYLTKRLEEAGQLDRTVIVLIGDHFPYYLPEDAVREFNGGTLPDSIERSHSTCIIYNAGMSEPIVSDVPCCNVDILPTILNLFNVDFDSRLLMGTDVFSEGLHRARLYNGSFVTKYLVYDRTTGDKTWSPEAEGMSEGEKEAYAEAMLDYTESEYAVSLGMIENNFFFYVWKNAGLMSAEEADAETAREKKGRSVYQSREAEDKARAEEAAQKKAEEEALKNGEAVPGQEGEQPVPAEGQPAPQENAAPAENTPPAPAEEAPPPPQE